METKDIVLLAVVLLILAELSYLLAKLPKTSIKSRGRAIFVDTSVLMDGRITGIARTGFIGGTLIVPRSVIGELQFLADNADADKRTRARYGLDIVTELQNMEDVEVEILQDGSKAEEGVDDRLLTLAKRHQGCILTLDYNLNKVAVVEGISVLNINELAQGLRMSYLPGEQMLIELTQKGQDSHQAVGYLPDGTMVVVEQSSSLIGQQVLVEVVRSLQTAAGKMMFAKRVADTKPPVQRKKSTTQNAQKSKGTSRTTASRKSGSESTEPEDNVPRIKRSRTQTKSVYHTVPKQTSENKSAASEPSVRRVSRRRKDHEASLIALVDNQKD